MHTQAHRGLRKSRVQLAPAAKLLLGPGEVNLGFVQPNLESLQEWKFHHLFR